MNDYKGLIENVRICASGDCCGCTLRGNKINCQEVLLESAADAIEQLVRGRDAAVDGLKQNANCDFCKWLVGGDCTDFEHEVCHGEHWEWRGAKRDNT